LDNLYEQETEKLMNVYNSIKESSGGFIEESITVEKNENSMNNLNGIKIGDMIVFKINEMELKGYVNNILNDKYVINGNFTNETKQISIEFDQIVEHYPKNVEFKDEESKIIKKQYTELKNTNIPSIKEDMVKPPVEKTLKNKSIVFFPDEMKQKEIDKALINFREAKYFIVEKNKELHIVKIKDGFEMKPFVEGVIQHLLKNKMIKEDISTMKVVGNDAFCIVKNSPIKTTSLIKGLLSNLLK